MKGIAVKNDEMTICKIWLWQAERKQKVKILLPESCLRAWRKSGAKIQALPWASMEWLTIK